VSTPDLPVAYCAPGHLWEARLTLAANGEDVAEVKEHPWLVGQDAVLLVREQPPLKVTAEDLFPKCGLCGWILPGHSVTCPVYWMIHMPPPPGPLITGLAGI
jgi:hypothetical protein